MGFTGGGSIARPRTPAPSSEFRGVGSLFFSSFLFFSLSIRRSRSLLDPAWLFLHPPPVKSGGWCVCPPAGNQRIEYGLWSHFSLFTMLLLFLLFLLLLIRACNGLLPPLWFVGLGKPMAVQKCRVVILVYLARIAAMCNAHTVNGPRERESESETDSEALPLLARIWRLGSCYRYFVHMRCKVRLCE